MSTRALLAGAVVALVAGLAGGALALALRSDGGGRSVTTTIVRGEPAAGFDPVAVYARAQNGVLTIESSFGVDDETAGSGFVVDAGKGLVVTAAHVVTEIDDGSTTATQASAVRIVLDDGTRADARVLGYDLFEDTALLQVDPGHLGLRTLALGRARSLRIGAPVAVIGSPFENRASLSTGVVSQLDRQISAKGVCFRTTGVIQTDAAVNPGNSGGPLMDAAGRVVGMVTAINPDARGGVAYAVPIEAVRRAYLALATGRQVPYAWLGVSAATLTPSLADSLGLSTQHGALVQSLSSGGAAQRAGLQVGADAVAVAGKTYARDADVITAVGHTAVAGFRDLDRAIGAHRAGDQVDLHVMRSNKARIVPVKLLPRPASFANCG
ncbi:MAG TPA: trypsin-like peptidase domain-containing protein [Gaiellales bacterium]